MTTSADHFIPKHPPRQAQDEAHEREKLSFQDLVSELQACFYNIATFADVLEEKDDEIIGDIGYVCRSLVSNGWDRLEKMLTGLQDLLGEIRIKIEGPCSGSEVRVVGVGFTPSKLLIEAMSNKAFEPGSFLTFKEKAKESV